MSEPRRPLKCRVEFTISIGIHRTQPNGATRRAILDWFETNRNHDAMLGWLASVLAEWLKDHGICGDVCVHHDVAWSDGRLDRVEPLWGYFRVDQKGEQ
jgi:hypothetical protein